MKRTVVINAVGLTPALIGQGISGLYARDAVGPGDEQLRHVGHTTERRHADLGAAGVDGHRAPAEDERDQCNQAEGDEKQPRDPPV